MESKNYKEHWDSVYERSETTKLGWYQVEASPSLKIIEDLNIKYEDPILVVGAGVTTLAEGLINKGYHNIIFSDISKNALVGLENRLQSYDIKFTYLVDDVTQPIELNKLNDITLWHDRAVLHFLTQESQRLEYVKLMHKVIKVGGFAIIATFSLDGAPKCSGLDVHRYSKEMLEDLMGKDFELVNSFDYMYIQPSGSERPYTYAIFKRIT